MNPENLNQGSLNDMQVGSYRRTSDGQWAQAVVVVDAATGSSTYDSAEFAVANSTTDYNVASNQANAFNRVKTASTLFIRTDQNISIKLNSISDPVITVYTIDSPFVLKGIPFTNLYISNSSGNTANVKVVLS